MSPFVLILVFTLGAGSALAIDMPNNATCEGAAQFSKSQESVSRGTPSAFVNDAKALAIARDGHRQRLCGRAQRRRATVPLSAVRTSGECRCSGTKRGDHFCLGRSDPELTKYAQAHKDIIDRFGRFPHRNAIRAAHPPRRKWNSSRVRAAHFEH